MKSELYGSLALTGKGHGTDKAVLLGLEGNEPRTVPIETIMTRFKMILQQKMLKLNNQFEIQFDQNEHLLFHKKKILPYHTNGMKFTALNSHNDPLLSMNYYSIGGGFFLSETDIQNIKDQDSKEVRVPLEFSTGKELIQMCEKHNLNIKELMMINEKTWRSEEQIMRELDDIWEVMENCIENGLKTTGQLPGPLKVRRRANTLYQQVVLRPNTLLKFLDYVSSYALSVSEENAAGSRVVTAPTNGAAGVVPAVLKYLKEFHSHELQPNFHRDFLLVASAIGIIIKKGASISGAEGGCQAEIGTACAMAAAAMVFVLGGNIYQICNAANIGLEHNLGLTCDPIFGLVQVPCIERNCMASIKAINSANLALRGDGQHIISFDRTIRVLKRTG